MKIKKMVYCAGFVGTMACSLLTLEKFKFEKQVVNHLENEGNHEGNVIAHRGFSSLEVENSFNSIKYGFECDCTDGVEIDIRMTKDNEIVLSHNASISGIGKIQNKTLKEFEGKKYSSDNISKLSLAKECILGLDGKLIYDRYKSEKEKKEYITTLNEVLESMESKKILLVDLKFGKDNNEKFMKKVNEIFEEYNGCLDIILQSNDYEELLTMKEKYPNYKYQLIIRKSNELQYLDSDFKMFGVRKNLITKDIVKNQKSKGKTISVWTINSCEEYESLNNELEEMMNDIFIITDYPDEICYLNNREKTKILK